MSNSNLLINNLPGFYRWKWYKSVDMIVAIESACRLISNFTIANNFVRLFSLDLLIRLRWGVNMNICLRANTCSKRNGTYNMFRFFSFCLNYINCTIKNIQLKFRVRSTFSFSENFDLCMLQQWELIKVSCFSALNDDTTGHITKINRWFLLNMIAFNCSTFCFTHFTLRFFFFFSLNFLLGADISHFICQLNRFEREKNSILLCFDLEVRKNHINHIIKNHLSKN